MRVETVTCDGCAADLTTRSNMVDYRLVLASESKPGYGAGFYTAMGINPAVERSHHFCGLNCLDRWSDNRRLYGKLRKEKFDAWKKEHGTGSGTMTVYPAPPDDVTAKWHAECKAVADADFPLAKRK